MNEFFGIRDAFFSFFRIETRKKSSWKKILRKKARIFRRISRSFERRMEFIKVSWILWAFEFRNSSISPD